MTKIKLIDNKLLEKAKENIDKEWLKEVLNAKRK